MRAESNAISQTRESSKLVFRFKESDLECEGRNRFVYIHRTPNISERERGYDVER